MPANEAYDAPHDYTKRSHNDPYTCRGPKVDGYWAQDGWFMDGESNPKEPPLASPKWVWVHNVMSRECHYDQWRTDPRCAGCEREHI